MNKAKISCYQRFIILSSGCVYRKDIEFLIGCSPSTANSIKRKVLSEMEARKEIVLSRYYIPAEHFMNYQNWSWKWIVDTAKDEQKILGQKF